MTTISLAEFKIKQEEYQRQAEEYRLAKSLSESKPLPASVFGPLGKMLSRFSSEASRGEN